MGAPDRPRRRRRRRYAMVAVSGGRGRRRRRRGSRVATVEDLPEVGPELAQAAEDPQLIVDAVGQDIAVPTELDVVPGLPRQQQQPLLAATGPAGRRRRIEDLPP